MKVLENLVKLRSYLNENEKNEFIDNSKLVESEFGLKRQYKDSDISLNVYFERDEDGDKLYISLYSSRKPGYDELKKLLKDGLFQKLKEKLDEEWKIYPGIDYFPGPLNSRGTKHFWGQPIDSSNVLEMDVILESYKKDKLKENSKFEVGNRVSICFAFRESFWEKTYKDQISIIRNDFSQIEKALNEMQ
jgi:hypothetical protein